MFKNSLKRVKHIENFTVYKEKYGEQYSSICSYSFLSCNKTSITDFFLFYFVFPNFEKSTGYFYF